MRKEWTVWVGGGEANDQLLTQVEAERLAYSYVEADYDDVCIENIRTNDVIKL